MAFAIIYLPSAEVLTWGLEKSEPLTFPTLTNARIVKNYYFLRLSPDGKFFMAKTSKEEIFDVVNKLHLLEIIEVE